MATPHEPNEPSNIPRTPTPQQIRRDDDGAPTFLQQQEPSKYPPGVAELMKCQEDDSPEKVANRQLLIDLLYKVGEHKLLELPKSSRGSGNKWKVLYNELFAHPGGLLCGYKKWTSRDPWTGKLKRTVTDSVDFFSNLYDLKNGHNPSPLEEIAHMSMETMKKAEKDKTIDKDQAYARNIQNEICEGEMGFTSSGNGVRSPSGVMLGPNEREGLSALGRPTSSATESRAINGAAVAAAASVSVPGRAFDPSRSRSAHEAHLSLANSAAKNQKTEHVSVKKARNMDSVALSDCLSGALSSSTTEFAKAMKLLAPSPSTRSNRSTHNTQQEINLVIQEIKGLMEINGDGTFDAELDNAKARLAHLQSKRTACNTGLALDLTKE